MKLLVAIVEKESTERQEQAEPIAETDWGCAYEMEWNADINRLLRSLHPPRANSKSKCDPFRSESDSDG